MENEQKYLARPGFTVREIVGESMLIPVNTSGVHLAAGMDLPEFNGMVQLDEVGVFLWNEMVSPKTLKELEEAVKKEFQTDGQDIETDIIEFLDTGIRNQIIFIIAD